MLTVTPIENTKGEQRMIFEEVPKDELCRCEHLRHAHKSTTISSGNPVDYADGRDLWEKKCANTRCTECDCKYFVLPSPESVKAKIDNWAVTHGLRG